MTEALLEKAGILLNQQRYDEAEQILGEILNLNPNDDHVLYLLSEINFQKDNYDRAEELINNAIALSPDSPYYYFLKSRLYYQKEKMAEAESFIKEAIAIYPEEAAFFSFWGQIKLYQKKFQDALEYANHALSIDSNDTFALNIRSTALLKLNRKEESFETIAEALQEDPNNAYTHSNYAWGLLEKGDVDKSLKHFSEALKNNPNSIHAREGMIEALKARFWIYKWFLKYSFWMTNMSAKYQWFFILGFYFGSKGLRALAASNETLAPYLYPLTMLLFVFAFSTWVIDPLSNLFLRFNYYGKHLLNKKQKISSSIIGGSLLISLLSLGAYFITAEFGYIVLAFFTFTMMIPLSRLFAKPTALFMGYNIFMFLVGALTTAGVFMTGIVGPLSMVYVVGLIAFQFLANYFVIKR
jgi:tetratricopeptide (TPR) repeat protein